MQNRLHRAVEPLISVHLNKKTFSGAAIAVARLGAGGYDRCFMNFGSADFASSGHKVSGQTCFDLASLSKPLVTALCIFVLSREEKININDYAEHYFGLDGGRFIIEDLLNHCSGLPAHRDFWAVKKLGSFEERKREVFRKIINESLVLEKQDIYSDLGFILLGFLIEQVTGTSLDEYWGTTIARPLGLSDRIFFRKNNHHDFAATGRCPWSGARLCGLVHDDNCRYLGGVAGHAGLFGRSSGVLSLCEVILSSYLGEGDFFFGLGNWLKSRENYRWQHGFDTVSPSGSLAGKYFSPSSIGHLGFTGTSFWLDPEKRIIIVLLTNRVINGNNPENINKLRPELHDKIMEIML